MNKLLLYPFLKVLSYFFPKKENVWVFGAWFGKKYADNPKTFYEYVQSNSIKTKCIWICADRKLALRIKNNGGLAYLYFSPKGLYFQLVASKVFVSHSLSADLMPGCFNRRTSVFNFWHGMPLKKIMYDGLANNSLKQKITCKVKQIIDWQSYLISTSDITQKLMSNAFRHPLNKVLITGLPRNDVLRMPLQVNDKLYNVYYMPTMRERSFEFDFFENYGLDFEKFDSILWENNIRLNIRLHPMNKIPLGTFMKIKKCKAIRVDSTDDIYASITACDCLITDYSSILFDYLILDRPVLFFCFDLYDYLKHEREMYFSYENIMFGQSHSCWSDIVNSVLKIKDKGLDGNALQQFNDLKERFHNQQSKSACKNIYEFINKS